LRPAAAIGLRLAPLIRQPIGQIIRKTAKQATPGFPC